MNVYIVIKDDQYGPKVIGAFATKELAEEEIKSWIENGSRMFDRNPENYWVVEENIQGNIDPELLTHDEIIKIHNKYTIVGEYETYREIERAVLIKNGFTPLTIQFDWDYLDSLLTDEDRKELEERHLNLFKENGLK